MMTAVSPKLYNIADHAGPNANAKLSIHTARSEEDRAIMPLNRQDPPRQMLPLLAIAVGQVRHAEAYEDMQRRGPVVVSQQAIQQIHPPSSTDAVMPRSFETAKRRGTLRLLGVRGRSGCPRSTPAVSTHHLRITSPPKRQIVGPIIMCGRMAPARYATSPRLMALSTAQQASHDRVPTTMRRPAPTSSTGYRSRSC